MQFLPRHVHLPHLSWHPFAISMFDEISAQAVDADAPISLERSLAAAMEDREATGQNTDAPLDPAVCDLTGIEDSMLSLP